MEYNQFHFAAWGTSCTQMQLGQHWDGVRALQSPQRAAIPANMLGGHLLLFTCSGRHDGRWYQSPWITEMGNGVRVLALRPGRARACQPPHPVGTVCLLGIQKNYRKNFKEGFDFVWRIFYQIFVNNRGCHRCWVAREEIWHLTPFKTGSMQTLYRFIE